MDELSGYLDRELRGRRMVEYELHLGQCRRCRALASSCRATIAMYQGQTTAALAPGLHQKVMSRVAAKPPFGPRRHLS
ncbi:MAG: zf-HC2 domain-containing protein [Terriglobales bacterium]